MKFGEISAPLIFHLVSPTISLHTTVSVPKFFQACKYIWPNYLHQVENFTRFCQGGSATGEKYPFASGEERHNIFSPLGSIVFEVVSFVGDDNIEGGQRIDRLGGDLIWNNNNFGNIFLNGLSKLFYNLNLLFFYIATQPFFYLFPPNMFKGWRANDEKRPFAQII